MRKIYLLLIISVLTSYFSFSQVHQLWGTTSSGGEIDAAGTIFKINLDGSGFSVVHVCDSTGLEPNGALVQAPNGLLFGTTEDGGALGAGVIFEYDPGNNKYADDFDFDFDSDTTGAFPESSLLLANNDMLYGMTKGGGYYYSGALFSFDPDTKAFTSVFVFSDSVGTYPSGYLIQANNGKLYGLTSDGGSNGDSTGTLFSYDIDSNTFSVLHNFADTTGINPYGSLVQAQDGKLYGMTFAGGHYGFGVIFSFDLDSNLYKVVYNFNDTTGSAPNGSLIKASDGLLYGMTSQGGANDFGAIFSFDPSINAYTDLFDFLGISGSGPDGQLMQASNGLLFGMTNFGGLSDSGVVFSFDQANKIYTDMHDFGYNDGAYPRAGLIELTSTGIAELKNVENTQLYPNPASDQLTIKSSGLAINRIEIYNVLGVSCVQSDLSDEGSKSEIRLNVSNLSDGVYFVHVYQAQNKWVGKFVKE